ncbi:MAG: hypothetical protein KDD47_16110 [Acidobacteria bacterium]|nr:hypothetical protein [Acidobacteriota bacterium]
MSPKSRCLFPALTILAAVTWFAVLPAEAAVFTVYLKNDTAFETLRQPKQAPWDDELVLVLTEAGNWIGLPKADIDRISASIEERGIGTVIDKKTIAIGVLANDEPTDEELAAEDAQKSPLDRFLDRLEELAEDTPSQPSYNQQQFVEPDQASGIPLNYLGDFAAPIGGSIQEADQQ